MLVDAYLSELGKIRSDKTIEFKSFALSYLDELKPLGRFELFELYRKMREKVSHATAIAYLNEIRRFYRWLSERGYSFEFSETAFKEIKAKKEFKGKVRKYFTEEEVSTILNYIRTKPMPHIYYVFTVFLLCSGLRLEEALSLKRCDIQQRKVAKDGALKTLYIVRVKGKFGKEREVPLYFWEEDYKNVWENFLAQANSEDLWLYKRQYPKSYKVLKLSRRSVLVAYYNMEKALGFPINAHRFRYTYATWLAMKGIPLNVLKEILGHSNARTTLEIYTQAQMEKVFDVFAI
jgi:Site-specific recombinase XerD